MKKRRFADGGDVEAANQTDDPIRALNKSRGWTADEEDTPKQSFKQAFAAARKAGDAKFTWNGKSYTTELAGEKKGSASSSKPNPSRPRAQANESTGEEPTPKARKASAEDIPTKGYPKVGGPGASDETETDRNVNNTLSALTGIAGLGRVGSAANKANRALKTGALEGEVVDAASKAARRTYNPSQLEGPKKAIGYERTKIGSEPAKLARSPEKISEFKKGGAVRGTGAAKKGFGKVRMF